MGGKGIFNKRLFIVFLIVFWKFLWGSKAVMEGDKVVFGGSSCPLCTKENVALVQNFLKHVDGAKFCEITKSSLCQNYCIEVITLT